MSDVTTSTRVTVEVWADIACPWCFIGTSRLDAAVDLASGAGAGPSAGVDVVFRSFELAPDLPVGPTQTIRDFNMKRLRMSEEQSSEVVRRVGSAAKRAGLALDLEATQVASTVLAHQLIHSASRQGQQRSTKSALFRAYFQEGKNVASFDDLVEIAAEAGLDESAAVDALRGGVHLAAVRDDERRATTLGITSIPFLLLNEKYALQGAQSVETIRQALVTVGGE